MKSYFYISGMYGEIDHFNDKFKEFYDKYTIPREVTRNNITSKFYFMNNETSVIVYDNLNLKKKKPVLIYSHGGGFVIENNICYDLVCRNYAKEEFIVFNFNYRLAPKFKFPTAHLDVYNGIKWLLKNKKKFKNADFNNIVLVGDSAGANIINGIYAKFINEKFKINVKSILLINPFYLVNRYSKSFRKYKNGYIIDKVNLI